MNKKGGGKVGKIERASEKVLLFGEVNMFSSHGRVLKVTGNPMEKQRYKPHKEGLERVYVSVA